MWIGQGKPTMAGGYRLVQQIFTFLSYRYWGLVCLVNTHLNLSQCFKQALSPQ